MKMACADLGTEDSRVHTKFSAERENLFVKRLKKSVLGSDGGFMVPAHSNIGKEMRRLRTTRELVRKTTAHSGLHRTQHHRFPFEQRSEVHRNQYCAQFSAAGNRMARGCIQRASMDSIDEHH